MNRVLQRLLVSILCAFASGPLVFAPSGGDPDVPAWFVTGVQGFCLTLLWVLVPYLVELVISNGRALPRDEEDHGNPSPRPRRRR